MSFNPLDEPVDFILLANTRSPGLAEVKAAASPRRWDVRRGYALSGARVVYRGLDLARPIVTLTLLTTEHWNAWEEFRPLVQREPIGRRASAKDIWHPILEDLGITAVIVEDVLQPKQVGDGKWDIDLKFIEHRPPVRRLSPVKSSDTAPEPQDANEIEIAALSQNNARRVARNAAVPD